MSEAASGGWLISCSEGQATVFRYVQAPISVPRRLRLQYFKRVPISVYGYKLDNIFVFCLYVLVKDSFLGGAG